MGRSPEIVGNTNIEHNNKESERYRLRPLRELDLENERDMTAYFQLLTHPDNIEHFANPPVDHQDLKRKLLRDHTHAYIAEIQDGTIVGGAGINDAAESEHDHFIVKVVIDSNYKGKGFGKKMIIELTDKAFSTPAVTYTVEGEQRERERIKLDVAVIRDIEGWDIMPRILRSLGYRFASLKENQVTIKERETGQEVTKPVETYEISREDWFMRRATLEQATNKNTN